MAAPIPLSAPRRLGACTTLASLLAIVAPGADDTDRIVPLDTLVISATRTPQDLRSVPSSVELIQLPDLTDRQVFDARTALAAVPGVIVSSTGATGSQSSLFIRGASSHQVSLMVDGVRMNDRSASYGNFLGGADLAGLDRLEVLRGPQSTLYGSSAMGGVVVLETAHGDSENPGGRLSVSAGSFDTLGGGIAGHGGSGPLDFSASVSSLHTDNDRAGNEFDVLSASTRVEGRTSDQLLLGATVRWQESEYAEPGSREFPYPGTIYFENTLVTAYGEWTDNARLRSRITAALHLRDYTYADDFGATIVEHTRHIVDWQNTWAASPTLEVVGGFNYETTRLLINAGRANDDLFAGYVSSTWRPREDVVLNAGLRHDEFDSVGGATTGRAGAAWLLDAGRTKLRATYGTGFTAPGADDRFGVPIWGQLGNPDIRPEECRGWDVGVDRDFAGGKVAVGVTYFQNRFRDLFEFEVTDFDTFEGMIVNRARAETEGAELAVRVRPASNLGASLAYTLLDATNLDNGSRLIRRPRHTLHLTGHWRATPALLVGGGMHLVADRFDNTGSGAAKIDDYTTVRLFASYAMRPEVILRARLENALDENYDEVFGYAALPRAFYGSVEWRF